MKFLLVTDLHYSDKPWGANNRYHEKSVEKVKFAIDNYSEGCEFIVCLGDIVDAFDGYKPQTEGLNDLNEMLSEYNIPFYATFGNHDTALDKNEFMRLTGMPARYYGFETDEYLCLMLDSCMNSKAQPYPKKEIKWADCYIDDEQIAWLKEKIKFAKKPVVVMTHVVVALGDEDHTLNNSDEITDILLENQDKIAAVFCGHYHDGFSARIGNIPYVVFKALCMGESVTCAVVEIKENQVNITGYGDEPSVRFER
ncbi:MAG: metallophosphoesterase [Clostridia bacterium]|nr:metallophosphoesterase [Clostridia bacterium]